MRTMKVEGKDGGMNAAPSLSDSSNLGWSPSSVAEDSHSCSENSQHTNTAIGSGNKSFPEVLKDILSDPSSSAAICWLPHGKSFTIKNRKLLVEQILPHYLGKATKYTSFTRKLSRWNFTRVTSGADEGAWFNKEFFRDDSGEKVREMRCAKRSAVGQSKTHRGRAKNQPSSSSRGPLKKRPVDTTLFPVTEKKYSPPPQKQLLNGMPTYMIQGRPLALADTRSVIAAAMEALIHSQAQPIPTNPTPQSWLQMQQF